jgi:hypothetical protein
LKLVKEGKHFDHHHQLLLAIVAARTKGRTTSPGRSASRTVA